MRFSYEELCKLTDQERVVIYLMESLYSLLGYMRAEYVTVKVDLALIGPKGLIIYSYNNGCEVNQYLISPRGIPNFIYSPGKENPDDHELFHPMTYSDVKEIFKKWEEKEVEDYPRTMLSKLEYLGKFNNIYKAYIVAIGYKKGISNKELFSYLFESMVKSIQAQVKEKQLREIPQIVERFLNPACIVKEAALKLLSKKFYGNIVDPRKDELYETLCLLSSAPYEKSQNRGRVGIATKRVLNSKALIKFSDPIEIKKENVRIIRKLMELSDTKHTILISESGRLIGVYSIANNKGKYNGTGVLFRGYGRWDLFSTPNGSIMSFDSVTIGLPNQSLERRIEDGLVRTGFMQCDKNVIISIVDQAKKQTHGTTIIVIDNAEAESDRLKEANRAIGINPIAVDESTILSLSAIDGAMIIDTKGMCYAIGAILDGEATGTGSIARGARYNSAITYVNYWMRKKDSIKAMAIIISSDDTVDIYPNRETIR